MTLWLERTYLHEEALMKKYHGTTMVQPWYTTVNSGIPWYNVTVPWYILVLPWYIANVPWYILVLPWCKHGTKNLYHGTLWYTMVHCICTIVHPFATIWNNLFVQWCIIVYHCTSLYHHGTNILYHGMLQCTIVQPCATMVHPWHKQLIPWYVILYENIL